MLYAVAALYAVAGLLYFIRFGGELSLTDRTSTLILIAVVMAGVAVQAIRAVPVELFFEAVSFYGFMAMLEHDEDASEHSMSRRFRGSAIIAITLVFLPVIVMNVSLILRLTGEQSDEIGNIRLDVIRSDLQNTITEAETNVLRVAMNVEAFLDADPSREEVARYFDARRESFLADGSFMNLYVAGSDWHVVPGFDAPPDFHAAERIWYIGAKEHPGEVYITEPYVDANTGTMCFTVSTMLDDEDTVVAMDLSFSKAQEAILRMTDGKDRTAMIVTSGGLIAGYTDMSLVCERADEKLPEYADVLRRVASSHEHGSFQVKLDGRPCMIFSSETSNNWYLRRRRPEAQAGAHQHPRKRREVHRRPGHRHLRRGADRGRREPVRAALHDPGHRHRHGRAPLQARGDRAAEGNAEPPAQRALIRRTSGAQISGFFHSPRKGMN